MRRPLGPLALLVLASWVGCAELPDLSEPRCGDGFVDTETEDCDGESRVLDGVAYACTPSCRLSCAPSLRAWCASGQEGPGCCPPGWGCSDAEEICREPLGQLEALGSTVASAPRIEVADFDGDGRRDVATLGGELSIHTLAGGVLSEAYGAAIPTLDAAIGRLTGDGTADIALPTPFGLGVLRGRAGGALEPTTYSSQIYAGEARFIALDAMPQGPGPDPQHRWAGDEILIFRDDGIYNGEDDYPILVDPKGAVHDLAGEIQAGQLDASTPCEEVVLPYRGAPAVYVYAPCQLQNGGYTWRNDLLGQIPLPKGWLVDEGVLVGRLDGDEHADVLVSGRYDDQRGLLLWRGGGAGLSAAAELLTSLPPERGAPLAAGDLNGDGALDLVDREGVHLSGAPRLRFGDLGLGLSGVPTEAKIADMNRDGAADVIVAFDAPPALVFLNNAGGGAFNPTLLSVDGRPSRLTVGDLDGDLVTDVAFAEALPQQGAATTDPASALSVAFGRAAGAPEAPVDVARFNGLEAIVGGRDVAPVGSFGDAMTDLAVLFGSPIAGVRSMAFFPATSDRLLDSPFLFREKDATSLVVPKFVTNVPLRAVVGRFDDDEHADVVVLTRPEAGQGARSLWLLKSTGEAALSPEVVVSAPGGIDWDAAQLGAIDAGFPCDPSVPSGPDRLVILAPLPGVGVPDALSTLVVVRVGPDGEYAVEQQLFLKERSWSGMQLVDMNGDGCRDIVALSGGGPPGPVTPQGSGPAAPAEGAVWTFWVRETVEGRSPVQALDAEDATIAAFACAEVSPPRDYKEIVLLTSTERYVASYDAGQDAFVPRRSGSSGGGNAIAAGDLDGDGIPDLAVVGGGSLTLLRTLPRLP